MQGRYQIDLGRGVKGTLKITLDVSKSSVEAAEARGIGKEEQENLVGQQFQQLIALLGCEDVA